MSRQIQTERGLIYVADMKLSRRNLEENGYSFSFTARDYDGNYIGRIWSNSKDMYHHDFIMELEPLNRFDVPVEVLEHVVDYIVEHSLGDLVQVSRASNHPEDDYLYHAITVNADGTYSCWTSWNESTQSLNFGHYGLVSESDAIAVINKYYNDITKE